VKHEITAVTSINDVYHVCDAALLRMSITSVTMRS
jgi:hypothetical protein